MILTSRIVFNVKLWSLISSNLGNLNLSNLGKLDNLGLTSSKNQMTRPNVVLHYYIHFLNSPGSSLRHKDSFGLKDRINEKIF